MFRKITKIMTAGLLTLALISQGGVPLLTFAAEQESEQYEIYPSPHKVEYLQGTTDLSGGVTIDYGSGVDEVTKNYLNKTLEEKNISVDGGSIRVKAAITTDDLANDAGYTPSTSGLYEKNDAYVLRVNDNGILLLGNDNDALFNGVSTLKIMLEQSDENKLLNTLIEDYADVQYRGVVEGYYGIPWSNENVVSYMEWGSKFKLNTFIYAPKDDPYHNSQWRDKYPEEELNKMKEMIEAGTRTKVRFIYAIHPFMSNGINKNDFDNEIKHITDKFEQLYDLGVRQFALLADDASSETALQVKTINALTQWLNSKEGTYPLIFCPQSYSGTPSDSYFSQFTDGTSIEINGKSEQVPPVDEKVEIMYTGNAIIGNVEDRNTQAFHDVTDRYPYYWLNWPTNDYTDSTLFLGKAEMLKGNQNHLNGLVSNPMCEAQLSKIGLFQVADYAWNIGAFDVDKSWKASFKNVDAEAADALAEVSKHMSYPKDGVYHQTGLAWEESEELAPYIEALESKVDAGQAAAEEAAALKAELEKILQATEDVMTLSKNDLLKSEFEPYRTSLDATLKASIAGLDALIYYDSDDYDTAWSEYGKISGLIDESNAVTKPGLKPEGNVQLEVKPGTKRLRPLAAYLNKKVGKLMNEMIGIGGETVSADPYYHFSGFSGVTDAEMEKYTDANDDTYASLQSGMQKAEDYYGIDLGEVKALSSVRVLQGSNDTDHDVFHYAVLEASADGIKWNTIKDYSEDGAPNLIEVNTNTKARYVRLRLTKQGYNNKNDYWLHVRDFSVTLNDGASVYTNVEDTSALALSETENELILTAQSLELANNQYAGLNLGKISTFTFASDNWPETLKLEFSFNGKVWEEADRDAKETITARYIRFVNETSASVAGIDAKLTVSQEITEEPSVRYFADSGTVDMYNATPLDNPPQQLLNITGLSNGTHTLMIQTHGKVGSDKISVDKFVVHSNADTEDVNLTKDTPNLKLYTDDKTKQWQKWSPKTNWMNEDELYLQDTTGAMVYTFNGTGIELYGAKSNNMGTFTYYVDGYAYNNSGDAVYDGSDATQAHYCSDFVTVDLGQSIDLKNIQVRVSEDTYQNHAEWAFGSGKIEVSENGTNWESVRDFHITGNETGEGKFDVHEQGMYYMDIDTNQKGRYIRIKLDEVKEFAVNEIVVNHGDILDEQDLALSTSEEQSRDNQLSFVTDGDLSTGFVINSKADGQVEMQLTEPDNVSQITIIQDANQISHANVEIFAEGKWMKIGSLEQSINIFDTTDYANVLAVRVSYSKGTAFKLLEITYKTDAALQPAMKYMVTFEVDGEVVDSERIAGGTIVGNPKDPQKNGYTFVGWYLNDKLYDLNTPVQQDITLVAKFEEIDRSALNEQIKKGAALKEENYTVESWNVFKNAYAKAQEILNDESSTQAMIDDACAALADAIENLAEVTKIDKTELYDVLLKYDGYHADDYTESSWKVFKDAYDRAKAVYLNDSTTQEEIDQAVADLKEAAEQLEKVDASSEQSPVKPDGSGEANPGTDNDDVTTVPEEHTSNENIPTGVHDNTLAYAGLGLVSLVVAVAGIRYRKRQTK